MVASAHFYPVTIMTVSALGVRISLLRFPSYALIRSSIQASSLSLGTIIRFPMVMVGKSLECISVYALAREMPSTEATSSAQSASGS